MDTVTKDRSGTFEVSRKGDRLDLLLSGRWTIADNRPAFRDMLDKGDPPAGGVRVDCGDVEVWDSQLVILLLEGRDVCRANGCPFDTGNLPSGLDRLLREAPEETKPVEEERSPGGLRERIAAVSFRAGEETLDVLAFTGETAAGCLRALKRPRKFRWSDLLEVIQQTGAQALPIVGLISFLVGMILAYQAVIQLRRFGADIFVADLVGLAIVREMGPMMAAVVLAGRTGAAFAAQIGAMKAGEELDALETFGLRTVDVVVLPRLLALVLMMPLLAIYANFLGILGGLLVGVTAMDLTPVTYMSRTQEAILLSDIYSGLIKSVAFGLLVAFAGCLRGMQCRRSSAGVGAAATSAVVTSILLVIVADAIFAVIFNLLGI